MNKEIRKMLDDYKNKTIDDKKNGLKEIIQEISLLGLSHTDFFSHAAFYGGTALRIFYGLDRFSEDMDFSLIQPESNFSLKDYLSAMEIELNSYGFEMSAEYKDKKNLSTVQSAFIKGNTLVQLISIMDTQPPISGVPNNEVIKIKIEIDTNPPAGAVYEQKFRLQPQPFSVKLYDRPSLFAGKLHALLCRNWKRRIKGRDFYDYIWYLSEGIPVNLPHLEARLIQTEHLSDAGSLSLSEVKELLYQRFEQVNFEQAKEDIIPFISNPDKLEIWSKDFFTAVTQEKLLVSVPRS